MYHETGILRTEDDLKLHTQTWGADKPRARVVLTHGYAEHSGRYEPLAHYLVAQGFSVHAFDLRGHGKSEGERAYVEHFADYVGDLHAFTCKLKEQAPKHAFFLIGHSMGGVVAAAYALKHMDTIQGLVLSAVGSRTGEDISALTKAAARVLSRVTPKLPVKKLDARTLSRDEAVVNDYDSDPLNYRGKMTARLANEIVAAGAEVEARAPELSLPLLVMHGGNDKLTSPDGSRAIYERAGSSDKTLKIYEGAYHEIFNDYGKEQVYEAIATWLSERL